MRGASFPNPIWCKTMSSKLPIASDSTSKPFLSRVLRAYSLCLACYPPAFRRQFAEEMTEAFTARCSHAYERGGVARLLRVALAGFFDLLRTAWAERIETTSFSTTASVKALNSQSLGAIGGQLGQDFHYAVRGMRARPKGSLGIVVLLTLGIAATTAVFSVVDKVLLRPLNYPNSERIAMIWERHPALAGGPPKHSVAPGNYWDLTKSPTVTNLAAVRRTVAILSAEDAPEPLEVGRVSASLFSILGVGALQGRTFDSQEEADQVDVAVLHHDLWMRKFGGDPAVVGRRILLNEKPHVVVGVMPRGFDFPPRITPTGVSAMAPADLWTPLQLTRQENARDSRYLRVFALLDEGNSIERLQAELSTTAAALARVYPATNFDTGFLAVALKDEVVANARTTLWVLLAAVGVLLMLTCANVANLQLATAGSREKDLAVRVALGADTGRLFRQILTENLLLAGLGGAAGLALGWYAVGSLEHILPATFPRLAELEFDGRAALVALAVSVGAGLLFGIAPAARFSRSGAATALREAGRSNTSAPRRNAVSRSLAIAQTALATVLLILAGLLTKSFVQLQQVDPGFRPDDLVAARFTLPASKYDTPPRIQQVHQTLLDRLSALPDVESAATSRFLPLEASRMGWNIEVENVAKQPGEPMPVALYHSVSPEYFEVMEIPLVSGRLLSRQDSKDSPPVAVISRKMASELWADVDPIGRRFRLGDEGAEAPWITVVGLVADVKKELDTVPRGAFYIPATQSPWPLRTTYMVARARPERLEAALQATPGLFRSLDPAIALYGLAAMDHRVASALGHQRLSARVMAAFAGLALLVASVGLYSLLSYAVAQRKRAVGVRLALGARPGTIVRQITAEGAWIGVSGASLGLLIGLPAARYAEGLLFETSSFDLLIFSLVALSLPLVAILATSIPAFRASRTDPMTVLRAD